MLYKQRVALKASLYNQSSVIMENTKCLIVKAHAPAFDLKVGVLLGYVVSLHFISCYSNISGDIPSNKYDLVNSALYPSFKLKQ